ncbi:MAG TPA: response regulator [Spirochaetia bacterium]|nr:response regulator [Spirochaetia bacterium]
MARILIVDDDTDLIEGQKAFLEKRGYHVETALAIEEGLEKARTTAPDIIIADLMMEHYDSGFVFCKKVRELPGLGTVPIIMQTAAPRKVGFTFETGAAPGREWMKVDEVLTKPVPLEHLLGKIEQYLSSRKTNA